MPATPTYALPYPDDSGFVIDAPSDMQALAEATDDALGQVQLNAEAGDAAVQLAAETFAQNDEVDWTSLTLLNGWTADPGYAPPGWMRDRSGHVLLRGLVSGGSGLLIANLPAGARPPYAEVLTAWSDAGNVSIDPAGDLFAGSLTGSISLSGLLYHPA